MNRLDSKTAQSKSPMTLMVKGITSAFMLALCVPSYAESGDHFHRWLEVIKKGHNTVGKIENQLEGSFIEGKDSTFSSHGDKGNSLGQDIDNEGFAVNYKESTRQNRERILNYLKKWVELDLFKFKSDTNRHRVYFDTYKRELVGQHRIGPYRYSVKLSQTKGQLRFKYSF